MSRYLEPAAAATAVLAAAVPLALPAVAMATTSRWATGGFVRGEEYLLRCYGEVRGCT